MIFFSPIFENKIRGKEVVYCFIIYYVFDWDLGKVGAIMR